MGPSGGDAADRADIAVIGTGPAGCAAAIAAAAEPGGRSVLLIGPEATPGDRPGESLSPAGTVELQALGLSALLDGGVHRPANAGYAAWGAALLAQKNAIQSLDGPGHVLDRPRFDRDMLDAAARIPAVVRVAERVEAAVRTGDGWSLTLTDGRVLGARILIDAGGRGAGIARRLTRLERADRLTGVCAFLSDPDPAVDLTPATLVEAVAAGWWYAALLPDRRLALAYFSDADLLPHGIGQGPQELTAGLAETTFIRRWLDSAGFRPTGSPVLASAGTTWLARAAGEDWLAAGDAAAAFDPLSSHGLTSGLWTGRRAGTAAVAALNGNDRALTDYADALARGVAAFLDQRRRLYGMERRWPDSPFWARRQGR
ncbi:MAG: hypothetical protein RLY86_4388 [Pseudomonadota bacterium]|jgi:flavin-dependent dehydrogenase